MTSLSTSAPAEPSRNRMTPLDTALEYARQGWPVFPCRNRDEEVIDQKTGEIILLKEKSPYTRRGLYAATTNPEQIRRWWSDHPDAMIGIPTGKPSGMWVLDLDKKGGKDGEQELAALEAEHGKLPPTITVRTPSGGLHMLFQSRDLEIRNRGQVGPAIDVRGDGGYVIAPGSVRADGRAYQWESVTVDVPADAPQWLLDLVLKRKDKCPPSVTSGSDNRPYVDAAITGELRKLIGTSAGRNNQLNDSAFAIGQFVGAGAIGRGEAEARLYGAAQANGYVAKDGAAATLATIRSGLDAGIANPRQIPEPTAKQEVSADLDATIARAPLLEATPFEWKDPSTLPRREFVYGKHLIRKYVSVTVAPGGIGKSSLTIAEALSVATGRPLLGDAPPRPMRVWLFNAEDPIDELDRRIMAACKHYGIRADEIHGRLFVNSGRDTEIVIAYEKNKGVEIAHPIVDAVKRTIIKNKIDVLVIDPFVSTHGVPENDNGAIDRVAKKWSQIADETNIAIEVVHHVRKVDGRDVTVEDARGAVSLLAAARSARVLNRMTSEQAQEAGVSEEERFSLFCVRRGKANLSPMSPQAEWRKLVSVPLGNGKKPTHDGDLAAAMQTQDFAPVVTEWRWPSAEDAVGGVSDSQFRVIKARIAATRPRENEQAADWAGHIIGAALGIDTENDKAAKKKAKRMLQAWIREGQLTIETEVDKIKNRVVKYVNIAA